MRLKHLAAMIVVSLLVGALVATGVSAEVYVDVVINGHRLYQAGLVRQDRTYVRLEEVASVLGGDMLYDPELRVAFVNTGRYAGTSTRRRAWFRSTPSFRGTSRCRRWCRGKECTTVFPEHILRSSRPPRAW